MLRYPREFDTGILKAVEVVKDASKLRRYAHAMRRLRWLLLACGAFGYHFVTATYHSVGNRGCLLVHPRCGETSWGTRLNRDAGRCAAHAVCSQHAAITER